MVEKVIELEKVKCPRLAFQTSTHGDSSLIAEAVIKYIEGNPKGISCKKYDGDKKKCNTMQDEFEDCYYSRFESFA